MALTLPAAANQTTLSGAFFQFSLNGQLVASGLTESWGMQYGGEWIQPVGTRHPLNDPTMNNGAGTIERANVYGNRLIDIVKATGLQSAQSIAQDGIDFGMLPMTGTVSYNDGAKKITRTLNELYIRRVQDRVEGNRLQRTTIDFEYSFETEQ